MTTRCAPRTPRCSCARRSPSCASAWSTARCSSARARAAATVTGAPISAAGRLAERAAPGEILLGDGVRTAIGALADADVEVDEGGGRLLALRVGPPALLRAPATPFVGRAHELAALQAALARVRDGRVCQLVTVAGPPGIGKSRLAREFLTAAAEDATVLAGRCLSYGEGTTYRAIADIVRGLGGDPRGRVEELLAGDEQAVRGVLSAIGLSRGAGAGRGDGMGGAAPLRAPGARPTARRRHRGHPLGRARRCWICSTTSRRCRAARRSCSSA